MGGGRRRGRDADYIRRRVSGRGREPPGIGVHEEEEETTTRMLLLLLLLPRMRWMLMLLLLLVLLVLLLGLPRGVAVGRGVGDGCRRFEALDTPTQNPPPFGEKKKRFSTWPKTLVSLTCLLTNLPLPLTT